MSMRTAILCAVLMLTLVACSSPPSDEPGPSNTTTPTEAPDRDAEDAEIEAYYPRLAECLTRHGFPATWNAAEGNMRVEVGPGHAQDEAAEEADASCQAELGAKPTRAPISENELDQFYDASLAQYECLVNQGYTPKEPPTREKWLAEYASGRAWDPFIDPNTGRPFPENVCSQPSVGDRPASSP